MLFAIQREERERERKGYTRGYLLPSSCQGTLVDGERERERERSWKWVSSSCDCFGFDLGSIYRVYTRICLNPPPSRLSSSETRHQLCCTDTKRERERVFIETCADSDGFEYVAKRGINSKDKNSL